MPEHYDRDQIDEQGAIGSPSDEVPTVNPGYHCNARKLDKQDGDEPNLFAGYCNNRAGKGTDHVGEGRCDRHGGAAPTKDENPNVGKGAAGPGNIRGMKHGLHANRTRFYDRLDDERQLMIDEFESAMIERYIDNNGRKPDKADVQDLFEIAVGYVLRDYAREWLSDQMDETDNPMLEHVKYEKDGKKQEFDKPNAILESIEDVRREDRMQRREKNLENSPEKQGANALMSITSMMQENEDDGS